MADVFSLLRLRHLITGELLQVLSALHRQRRPGEE
jgi:hypothetical protein